MENDLEPDARCVSLRCAGRGHGIPFPKIAFYCEFRRHGCSADCCTTFENVA